MDVRSEMLGKIRNRRDGFSLEQPFYTSEDYFRLDMELIYYRDWLFAGHDCELPKPGSYLTLQIGDYPVLIVRDAKGEIRAFHNSCRHRGSRVCTAAKGTTAKLVCPYHQWTYELDGRLLFARQMGDNFDASQFGLKPIACETTSGYIFICLDETPADFAPFKAQLNSYLGPHHIKDVKVAHETTIVEKGNWKLVWENNRECYHCAGNHPELCKSYPEAPVVTGVTSIGADADMVAHWNKCEAQGLPSTFRMSDDGQYRTVRAPLLRDAVSFTMSGKPAVAKNLSDSVNGDKIGAMMFYHYPSTWNHALIDHAISFRVMPLSANETEVTTKWMVHKDAVEGVDYDIANLTHVWNMTNDEDRRIVEENAFGIRSPAYEPGPYSLVHEGGVQQFVEWYCGFIEPRLAEGETPKLRSVA